jgi:hypothetical protein
MAEQPPTARIDPGQHKTFLYVGDFIPNKVLVQNLGTAEAKFRLTSAPPTPPGWVYYEVTPGSSLRSFTVHFPTAKLTVYNDGPTPIEVAGEGIRPT